MILHTEGATDALASEAKLILEILTAAYPGHPWAVRCDGGIIFIRHLQFGSVGGSKQYGMNVKFRDVNHDSAVMKREIIMKAGEWLERAGLVRGRENGDEIVRIEGIPEQDQPHRTLEGWEIVKSEGEMRTEPRPQVRKLNG